MSKGFASNYRVSLLAGIILALFGVLVARLAWLQVIDRPHLLTFIEKARHAVIPEYARRGDMVDANDQLLATSVSLVQVYVDPRDVHAQESAKWRELARLLDMPLADVEKTLTTQFKATAQPSAGASPDRVLNSRANPGFKIVLPDLGAGAPGEPAQPAEFAADIAEIDAGAAASPIAEAGPTDESDPESDDAVEPDSAGLQRIRYAKLKQVPAAVYAQIEALKIGGVHGDSVYRREYPQDSLAAHLIGYVNHEQQPVAGMEKYANFFLRGQNGWVETEKDGHGHEVARFRKREVPPADGYNLKLSIDTTVQQMAEAELEIIHQKFHPRKATIIVSDPRTGFILALANFPSFDLNHYNSVPKEERAAMQNVAISSLYEPGSVFKIVAASGALEEGLVTPETLIDCSIDRIVYDGDKLYPAGKPRPLLHDDKDDHFDAPIPVWRVLAKSSNRGAVQLAMRLGDERFYKYVQGFGFSLPTGFPVGGEPGAAALRRNAPPPSKWDGLTITRMPAGYSIAVTPLQMHQAMSVIASGGLLLKPQIIQKVYDQSGEGVYHFDRSEERRVISEATARTMAGLLQRVATKEGTAESAQIVLNGVDYQVAGKTGTAQKPLAVKLPDGRVVMKGYSTHNHVGSFVGFFPASDPQIEISVIVDDADEHFMGKTAYGTLVAAPSFKHLGEELISYRSIRPPTSAPPPVRTMVALEGGRR